MHSTQKGMQDQMAAMQQDSAAMGEAFDASTNDDSFYLPPEVFENADFQEGHGAIHLTERACGALHHLP